MIRSRPVAHDPANRSRPPSRLPAWAPFILAGLIPVARAAAHRARRRSARPRAVDAAEAALAAEHDLLDAVRAHLPDPAYVKDLNSRFLRLNQAAADNLGVSEPAEAIGRTDFVFFPESLARRYFEDEQQVVRTGEPLLNRLEPQGEDGSAAWWLTSTAPLRDAEGRVVGLIGIARDVTERRRLEHDLRAAEERYRSLVEQLPTVVYADAAERLGLPRYVSPQIEALLGYTAAEWLADPDLWVSRLHPGDRERVVAATEQANATGGSLTIEYRMFARDDRVVWLRDQAVLAPDHDGVSRQWLGFQFDITERVAAEAALREREQRHRALLAALPDLVFLIDHDGVYLDIEAKRLDDLVAPPAELLGRTVVDMLPPPAGDRILTAIRQVLDRGGIETVEYDLDLDAGRRAWEARIVAAGPNEAVLVGRDVTERKRFEAELLAAKDAAEEASRLKSAFLSTMSHELRTPLNAIIGYAAILADGMAGPLTEQQQADVEQIAQGGARLLGLINDVLDLSRIESGRLELDREPVDVAEALGQVRADLLPAAEAKGLSLTLDLPTSLPPLRTDRLRLHQILLNLAGNAVKFTGAGGVTLSARSASGGIAIVVRDTGIGIAPEVLPYIFDEFRQADSSTTRKFGGSGLGLAITRRLVTMLDGSIIVESTAGAGAAFTLWFPADGAPDGAMGES
ncbi:MAG: PAS domain-containing protein [Thermomicrobiales bacterium]|nr:PAS domain-containing protein [Thermomicrobiales bacterium]